MEKHQGKWLINIETTKDIFEEGDKVRAYQIGVVSRGRGCANFNSPAIFGSVGRVLKWIRKIVHRAMKHNHTGYCTKKRCGRHWVLLRQYLTKIFCELVSKAYNWIVHLAQVLMKDAKTKWKCIQPVKNKTSQY